MAAITISAPATHGPISRRPVEVVSRTANAPVRLTARGRRLARTLVIALALVVTLVAAIVAGIPSSQAGDGAAVPATATVVVQPGQTLWEVARGVATGVDVRETVARIKDLNGLSGAGSDTVVPGQALVVPAAG